MVQTNLIIHLPFFISKYLFEVTLIIMLKQAFHKYWLSRQAMNEWANKYCSIAQPQFNIHRIAFGWLLQWMSQVYVWPHRSLGTFYKPETGGLDRAFSETLWIFASVEPLNWISNINFILGINSVVLFRRVQLM